MMRKIFPLAPVLATLLVTSLVGCATENQFAGMEPDQIRAANNRIETTAQISTVAFKELGDTKRGEVLQRIIRTTWGESCKPVSIIPNGYSPNGASQWSVRCSGGILFKDYVVALPERADGLARVLKCFKTGPNQVTCNVMGRLPGA